MMTLAGQQRPVSVMSNNNAREKSGNHNFLKVFPHWFAITQTHFPEVFILDDAAENQEMKMSQPKIEKDFPPQHT